LLPLDVNRHGGFGVRRVNARVRDWLIVGRLGRGDGGITIDHRGISGDCIGNLCLCRSNLGCLNYGKLAVEIVGSTALDPYPQLLDHSTSIMPCGWIAATAVRKAGTKRKLFMVGVSVRFNSFLYFDDVFVGVAMDL
jgi:hypothetical protein